ncbi:nucleosome-remodeling factor subunit NURF301 isoform X1 [Macrobrachium rosenbergii]|uniref:nucleosome-remodeling factor subunit NURF301 isoform X1 n=1 Tax=Macrobrachium rosenbergii TaxID=79674 RepID=UPI0034D60F1F
MSERKRKRGRPRSTPVLSYSSEMKMRNSIARVIKKPRYLMEQEDESNHNHSRSSCSPSSSRSSQFVGYDKSGGSHSQSSGGNSKGRNKRGYNPDFDDKDSEYLYGSDFELEDDGLSDDKEEIGESVSGSDVELGEDGEEEDDLAFSDGEASMSSFSTVSESQIKSCFSSRPQTPIPVWLQDREYPPLELPHSADDLLLPRAYVLKAVGIYEVLRHFRTLVRLSPMRFEDFCAALMVEEQSSLLAEVHMALLKALIREEDSQQTHFGPLDQKDSINVILYFIDALSWPESLRLYLQSDREFFPTLKILNSCNYPYTSLVNRLQVLQFLCDQFLQTSVVREDLLSEGKLRYDDHCRACHKTGDLLCCDSCSAVYHLDCVDPPLQDIPGEMEDWTCSVCTAHQVEGVTDCISPMETSGNLCRQDPLGFDRHGRKYWFLVRRLFIESEDGEIWYYTTQAQLEEIQSLLDAADLEEDLCNTLQEILPEMKRHMAVTESLTEENKGNRKTCLEIEDDFVKKRCEERKEKQRKREQENADKLIEEIKQEVEVKEEPIENNDSIDTSQIKEEPDDSKDGNSGHVSGLDPVTGEMTDTSKSGLKNSTSKTVEVKTENPAAIDSKQNVADDSKEKCKKEIDNIGLLTEIKIKISQMNSSTKWYRLGCDGKYKSYVNQYSSNPLALNKLQHNEERDKKRHLSHKFSLTPAAEFKWSGVLYGNKESLISTLRHTILSLEQSISSHLFHPHWSNVRKAWNLAVMSSGEPVNFSKVLMWLVACIKPVVFNSVWHDSLGHVRFNRVTALEREEKKKQEKREKKDPDQEELRPVTIVKYTLGLKHQVWKLKGEEYRMHAMWGWQWVASHRQTKHVPMSSVGLRAGPDKYMVPIKGSAGLQSLSVNPSIFKQLILKTPSLKPSLLSPKQLAAEADCSEAPPEEKKNEIIIASASGQQKVEVGTVKLEDLFVDGLVNVSQALNSKFRFVYPKVAKASVLDSFLNRRIALRSQEEKDLANKKVQGSDTKGEEEEDEIDVENDDTDATLSDESDHENIDEIPDSQRSTIHKQRPAGNLLKEIRTLKLKYETIDELDSNYSCYSVICRNSERCHCYSPTCLLKMRTKDKLLSSVKNYRIVTSKPAPFDEVGAHSPVRLTNIDADTNSVTKVESVSESVTTTSTSTITSVNGQVVNTTVSNSVEVSQVKSESTDSSDGRSSRASSEIKIRMDEDIDETSQGSISTESKFSLKNNRIYSSESTSGKVYLKKLSSEVKRVKKLQYRIPPLSSFKIGKKNASVDKRLSSLLVLPRWEIRMLARKGGRFYVNGFNHNAKANNSVWPYPCSRPAFKTVWQYRTSIMPTLNSVAMQLRILWVCLRWDDMQEKGPGDGRKQITTDMEIVQTEILKRKHYSRFLEKTEYLRRKVTIPFDVPKPVREFTPSQRSGLRKRRRAQSPVNKEPQSVEEWVEEERLDLWEIRFFGERLERAATVSKRSVGERGECIQTVTTRGSSPAEIRARMEEQLKIQRANFNQKKALESTPPGKGGIVRLSICSAGTITTATGTKLAIPSNPNATTKVVQAGGSTIMAIGGQLPIVSGKKFMTTRDGRIITVQTTQTPNSASGSSQQSSGTTDKSISLGSSTIFPVGGAPKVQVTSQGNKVIRLQAVGSGGGQRMILPLSANTTVVQTRTPRPATPMSTPTSASTNTNTPSTPSGTPTSGPRAPGQQIQIIRLPDGQLQVRGLLEGQQLVQRSDGKFQLINKSQLPSNNQSSSSGTSASPAIQVTQQTKTVQPCAVSSSSNTAFTSKVNSTAASSTASTHVTNTSGSHVVKVNGMQVLLKQLPEAKQVVTVGASEAAAVSTSSANSVRAGISQSGHTSPRIKTMLAPDGTMVKTVMSTTSSSSAVSPVTTTAATNSTCTTTSASGESPVTSSSQNNNNNTTSGSSLTLKVQVRMTEQGPKTIIQGLQPGVGLTKDHIMAIQQQVRNMLAQYNLQVNQLSPVMTLTLHVPNKQQVQPSSTASEQSNEASEEVKKSTPPQTEPQQAQGNTNAAVFRNLLSPQSQMSSQSPAVIAVKNASAETPNVNAGAETEASEQVPAAQSPSEDGLSSPNPPNKEFVLTQEYIQQAIKSVLSRDDLNPEVEEKLMQLQKYNIEQTKKEETPVPVGGSNTSASVNSTSRNSAVKRSREQDDSDWDPVEEKSVNVVTVTPSKPRPKKPRSESRQTDSSKPKKSTVKNEALDIRKKQALQHKLESLMTRHKDFLKKDILKKRAQLEKELQVEIHKELSVARVQLQMLEKNKADSSLPSPAISPRKKKTISESSPSQVVPAGTNQLSPETSRLTQTSSASQNNINSNKNSSISKSPSSKPSSKSASTKKTSKNKNKKIVCICRTPFDDTKFYVGCDLCGNWFHGDCVGITEAMSRSMTEYVCDDCANAKLNKELFCFCRQPYDETQFYICCEQCEDWYHGKCVGIMQSEADDIDDYICPKCDSNNVWNYPCQKALSSKDYVELKKLTKGLIQHKNAWPFLEPVDPSEVPDYYKVVKEPMDLKTVENRVENKSYPRLAQFIGDVMLVFDNCRLYNPPNSSFCSCAATLESFFCQKLRSLKTRLSQR